MYTNGKEKLSHRSLQDRLGVSFPRGNPPEGWALVDNTPPEPTLDEIKQRKRSEINGSYQQELAVITDKYPDTEKLTWDRQEAEARAHLVDPNADTPFLSELAADPDIDMSELAQGIVDNADAWVAMSAAATRKRHKLRKAIDDATTPEDLDLIQW